MVADVERVGVPLGLGIQGGGYCTVTRQQERRIGGHLAQILGQRGVDVRRADVSVDAIRRQIVKSLTGALEDAAAACTVNGIARKAARVCH